MIEPGGYAHRGYARRRRGKGRSDSGARVQAEVTTRTSAPSHGLAARRTLGRRVASSSDAAFWARVDELEREIGYPPGDFGGRILAIMVAVGESPTHGR